MTNASTNENTNANGRANESGRANENGRVAYQGECILTANHSRATDTWESGLNNNVLVLGCSGGGKTRHHLKPNLIQAHGSYIVLDTKGALCREVGPYLQSQGYRVDCLDFTTMQGTVGYNPLDHVRRAGGKPMGQDMIAIANAICPPSDSSSDPFWEHAAANYLTSYIAYVFEALPENEQTFSSVVSVFESAGKGLTDGLFRRLEQRDFHSYAARLYNMAKATANAEKMHSSIFGIIAAHLLPFSFEGVQRCFEKPRRVDFASFGHEKRALFVTLDDLDRSLAPLTGLFVHQALTALCDEADRNCADGRLPVPVHLMLDDFANLYLPDFDNVLSVIRSREISATVICQTVSQLEAAYGQAAANSIIGNCDTQLVLAFQDAATAEYFGVRADRTASDLLETPAGKWWLFLRGKRGLCDDAYRLEGHPAYKAMRDARFVREAQPPVVLRGGGYEGCYDDLESFAFSEGLDDALPFAS